MIKTILFAVVVLSATFHESEGRISLESCSLSCDENEDQVYNSLGTRAGLQGPPGKLGPVGQKGENGVKGDTGAEGRSGRRGHPGSSCDCSRYDEIATQVVALQQELNVLKGRARLAPEGWSRASNNRWYKFFYHEVNYETAKSRCAVFGSKLASTGLRTAQLRSEIKKLLPNPMPDTWIGLDDLLIRGNYIWADGVSSTRSNTEWGNGQPNTSSDRCGVMVGHNRGRLSDELCSDTYNYLCEF